MLMERDLKQLISYHPDSPVLSVYLNLDPRAGSADIHKRRLRQMLKVYQANMPEDKAALERYLDLEYDWAGRGLAIFSCASQGFFRAHSLPMPVRDRARVLPRPYVKPLADLLDNFGNNGVVLIDQQGARLFHLHLGELVDEAAYHGEEVRRIKRGGGSQSAGRRGGTSGQTRYAEELADRNLKDISKLAARFFDDRQVRRIMVGGTEAMTARFIQALPKKWQSLVVGSFPIEMAAGHAQVIERALQVGQRAEERQEAALVEAVITATAKGGEGVLGLDETLSAVHAGRVKTLIIAEGFRAPGFRCRGCSYLVGYQLEQCPFCGGSFEHLEDAVEHALRHVLEDGGEVEVVRTSPALEKAGRIGGLLRY